MGDKVKQPAYVKLANMFFESVANASWKKIAKVYFVSFLFLATIVGALFLYTASKDVEIVKTVTENITAKEANAEDLRDVVITPKIQQELYELVNVINADRAFIFELHNGKKNTSGLPFRFANMTYEEVNDSKKAYRVAMEFQDIPLTLYKFPNYLQKKKIFIGSVDDVYKVDDGFASHIENIGGKYVAMIYMSSGGLPIGFLCISYHDLNDVPDDKFIEDKLREYDRLISSLLDLNTHINDLK